MRNLTPKEEEWRKNFKQSVLAMCRHGFLFEEEINVSGTVAITVDKKDVVVVNIQEHFAGKNATMLVPKAMNLQDRDKIVDEIFKNKPQVSVTGKQLDFLMILMCH